MKTELKIEAKSRLSAAPKGMLAKSIKTLEPSVTAFTEAPFKTRAAIAKSALLKLNKLIKQDIADSVESIGGVKFKSDNEFDGGELHLNRKDAGEYSLAYTWNDPKGKLIVFRVSFICGSSSRASLDISIGKDAVKIRVDHKYVRYEFSKGKFKQANFYKLVDKAVGNWEAFLEKHRAP